MGSTSTSTPVLNSYKIYVLSGMPRIILFCLNEKSSPPLKRSGLLNNGGGAEIRTPDTADMSRML